MGLPIFDRAAVTANGNWYYASALGSMGGELSFHCCVVKYWSNLHTVSEKMFCFGLKMSVL